MNFDAIFLFNVIYCLTQAFIIWNCYMAFMCSLDVSSMVLIGYFKFYDTLGNMVQTFTGLIKCHGSWAIDLKIISMN